MTISNLWRKSFFSIAAAIGGVAFAAETPPPSDPSGGVDSRVALELVAEGFIAPIALEEIADGSNRLVVADQTGLLLLLSKSGKGERHTLLDISDRMISLRAGFDDRGLLGFALHPGFRENRRLFVFYTAPLQVDGPADFDHTARLSQFEVNEDFSSADVASEKVLLEIHQPQANHDGGSMAFGPDGYLYLSLGDGGAGNDVGLGHSEIGNGQDISTLLGSLLRLDVDVAGSAPYSIPSDNPFVGQEGRDEIFAYGLRTTWGLSFDEDGTLYGADVGQNLFEEVNVLVRGGNYGWNLREGFHAFAPDSPHQSPQGGPKTGVRGEALVDPIFEYKNTGVFSKEADAYGVSVIGGHRYRGSNLPHLEGRYIFADWSRQWGLGLGTLLVATPPEDDDQRAGWKVEKFRITTHPNGQLEEFILGVGRDATDELYFMTTSNQDPSGLTGRIYRLGAAPMKAKVRK